MTKALLKQTSLPPRSLAISYQSMPNPVFLRYLKTSPKIIQLAAMLYVRFPLSLRNVDDLLHERGGDVSYESVWHKWLAGQVNHLRIWIAWQFCLIVSS